MDRLARLLDDCRAHPDDDGPRLVWADAAGGERGEFVVLQCELARGVGDPLRAGELHRRSDELLARHGADWAGLHDVARAVEFRRGFVEVVKLDGAHAPSQVMARAPLARSLVSVVRDRPQIDRLFAAAELSALAGLYIELAAPPSASRILHPLGLRPRGHGAAIDDHLAARRLPALRAFGSNAVDADLLTHLPFLAALERLHIPGVRLTRSQAIGLFARMPRLRALSLQTHDDAVLDLIPAGVVELFVDLVDDYEVAALGRCPATASIERLALLGRTDGDLRPLEAFRRLRSLDLDHLDVRGSVRMAITGFADLGLPSLRELSVRWPDDILPIARAHGPQLERLESRAPSADLAALVAGTTLANRAYPPRRLGIATTTATEGSWLARNVVEYIAE